MRQASIFQLIPLCFVTSGERNCGKRGRELGFWDNLVLSTCEGLFPGGIEMEISRVLNGPQALNMTLV
jgi:hypothetical protein